MKFIWRHFFVSKQQQKKDRCYLTAAWNNIFKKQMMDADPVI